MNDSGEKEASVEQAKRYLVFREGKYILSLDLDAIKRVYDAEAGFTPRTSGSRIIDLVDLTGTSGSIAHPYWIEMEIGAGRFLMPVEEIEGLNDLTLAIKMDYPPVLRRPEANYYKAVFFDGARMIVELDPAALAEIGEAATGPRRKARRKTARDLAKDLPAAAAQPAAGGRQIVFDAGGRRFQLDLDRVIQVVNHGELYPAPLLGERVAGLKYFKDHAAPVLAPHAFVELLLGETIKPGPFALIVVIETAKGLLGLGCDRIIKVTAKPGEAAGEPGRDAAPVEAAVAVDIDKLLEEIV